MSFADPTYVVFDGDEDKWAYAYMLGWKKNDKVNFDFNNAHDLGPMTARAENEAYVKSELKKRMLASSAVLVLIGKKTKNLYTFVRWELELAQKLGLPVIAVNLNGSRFQDESCPPIIRDTCVLHVSFNMKIIKYALDEYVPAFRLFSVATKAEGWRYYNDDIYKALGL